MIDQERWIFFVLDELLNGITSEVFTIRFFHSLVQVPINVAILTWISALCGMHWPKYSSILWIVLCCVVLMPTLSICIRRCQERTHHERITPTEAARVVTMMQRQWQIPNQQEQQQYQAFRTYHVVKPSEEFNAALTFHLHQ